MIEWLIEGVYYGYTWGFAILALIFVLGGVAAKLEARYEA